MSNMYLEYVGKTLNFVGGGCPWGCSYCYVKDFTYPSLIKRYSGNPYLIEATFNKSLGKNKRYFINNCSDFCAIPMRWKKLILKRLWEFPTNTYLIQSKNPKGFRNLKFPPKTILGTTIETNRDYGISNAPVPFERMVEMHTLAYGQGMCNIEPIMDFDLNILVDWMEQMMPKYVSIGADSGDNKLPEPNPEKVKALIDELKKFTEVRIKPNLNRIIG